MTYRELLRKGQLELTGMAEAKVDAMLLFEYVTGFDRMKLITDGGLECSLEAEASYLSLIKKRKEHVPVQYIMGYTYFYGRRFYVTKDVLIPRFDTEILVSSALDCMDGREKILDMCTGSGCIAITVALEKSNTCVTAVDISMAALEIAKANASKLMANVTFVQSDLFEHIDGRYDMIISNPPYIESAVIESLDPAVKDMEPRLALDGGIDGLDIYRRLVFDATSHLEDDGILILEIGYNQGEALSALLTENGFEDIEVIKDLAGLDRVVKGVYRRM
ncbi:MAG: peptide chain release factor N(5)-glutamine methyltransferase [Lachnospiraceae bacterium]|nr:peptide chain release factor N(5)-glutamine methyltransferase [Lachnospiraceae bacterium]